ncbi:LutC/YkgG family protein [Alicyclobacillus macrosporangiidus]|uniref:LutC/YkgG family protein n=1 Tax=Alicyclobacillus macrosporangiidus TaxID=392015 RepID=UPI000497FEF4|nr:lactate utilization protein [Alicyclobacillus macrosporangiidus]
MNEADFLQRIAARLGRSTPLAEAPPRETIGAPEFWQAYTLPLPERIDKFITELEKLGGHARAFDSLEGLRQGLRELLTQLAPARVGTWGPEWVAEHGLEDVLSGYDVVQWTGPDADRRQVVERFAQVDVGITGCAFAVADTGTIGVVTSPQQGRSVSLLPPVHIALVPVSRLYTRLGEALAQVAADRAGVPSSVNFITGPSRSSDIEGDGTVGIHGPAAVYALLWQDQGEAL